MPSDLRQLATTHLSSDQKAELRQQCVAELSVVCAQMQTEPESVEHIEDAFHLLGEISVLTPRVTVQ